MSAALICVACLCVEDSLCVVLTWNENTQEKWNGKLDQTLEVANEAFGEKTPFVIKANVEQLESGMI